MESVKEIVTIKQIVSEREVNYGGRIDSTEKAANMARAQIGDESREIVLLAVLNAANEINAIHRAFSGGNTMSLLFPREIFQAAILNNGVRIILFHNHPSGDVKPSDADLEMTVRLARAGDFMGIPLLDHIIVSETGWTSMKELGYF